MSILYTCYSPKMMKWLTNVKDFRYELVALNPNSQKTFWVFIRDEKFNKALEDWSRRK